MKTYILQTIDGEQKLKEKNPFEEQQFIGGTGAGIQFDQFEQTAISNAKVLLNPVEGRVEFTESELTIVYQMQDTETGIWGTLRYITELVDDTESPVREVFKYTGQVTASPTVAERNRIVGLIESRIGFHTELLKSRQSATAQILIAENEYLLNLIKDGKE